MSQAPIGQTPQKITGPDHDPVDDIIGWCPDGGCSFHLFQMKMMIVQNEVLL